MKKKLFLIIIGLLLCYYGIAQVDYESVLRRANSQILSADYFKTDLTYRVYNAQRPGVQLEESRGKYIRKGKDSYHRMGSTITINANNKFLVVDEPNKVMMYGKMENQYNPFTLEFFNVQVIRKFIRSVNTSKTLMGTRYTFLFTDQHPSISKMSFDINEQGFITRLSFQYSREMEYQVGSEIEKIKPKVEILFSNISTAKTQTNEFRISKYILSDSDKVKPTLQYKDYELFVN